MTTPPEELPDCDPHIRRAGRTVAVVRDRNPQELEQIVRDVRRELATVPIDWYTMGGRDLIVVLGGEQDRERARLALLPHVGPGFLLCEENATFSARTVSPVRVVLARDFVLYAHGTVMCMALARVCQSSGIAFAVEPARSDRRAGPYVVCALPVDMGGLTFSGHQILALLASRFPPAVSAAFTLETTVRLHP